jgi:ligand-binding SRPBCC domain-containing protein
MRLLRRRTLVVGGTQHVLEHVQTVAAPIDDVFAFFRDPQNLARITPAWMGFSIERAPDRAIFAGAEIEYTIRWLGLPVRWKTRITEYVEGERFVDTQVSGPYRRWVHAHTFIPAGETTVMHDRVEYELPLGAFGMLAHTVLVRRQLEQIFAHCSRMIEQIFAEAGASVVSG